MGVGRDAGIRKHWACPYVEGIEWKSAFDFRKLHTLSIST